MCFQPRQALLSEQIPQVFPLKLTLSAGMRPQNEKLLFRLFDESVYFSSF